MIEEQHLDGFVEVMVVRGKADNCRSGVELERVDFG